MTTEVVIWGPPGTGKTTAGISIARGFNLSEVAYLAFTRAAANEAVYRIAEGRFGGDDDCPYFRTIHSLAFRGMKRVREGIGVVTSIDMNRFAKATGLDGMYSLSGWEDISDAYRSLQSTRTEWDKAFVAYNLSRFASTTQEELEAARHVPAKIVNSSSTVGRLEESTYQAFVKRYEAFKAQEGLVDFTDMLAFALTSMPRLEGVRLLIVDEAQDLCPIHYAIIDKLFEGVETIVWIGDDDQAIYQFSGACAEIFLDRARRARYEIQLRHTHRFGQGIVDFSQKVIQRVRTRRHKEVIGVEGREHRISLVGKFVPMTGESLVLHRHVEGCREIGKVFIAAGLPFRNERGKDPLSSDSRIKAFTALDALSKGEAAETSSVRILIEDIIPSVVVTDGCRVRLVTHGGKSKISKVSSSESVTLNDLKSILTDEGIKTIMQRQYHVLRHGDDLEYYHRVVANGRRLDEPCPIITTIHGAKGRQATSVTVFSEMSRRCWQDYDGENRVAYVGSTRTMGDLTICAERTVSWAQLDFPYPSEDEHHAEPC